MRAIKKRVKLRKVYLFSSNRERQDWLKDCGLKCLRNSQRWKLKTLCRDEKGGEKKLRKLFNFQFKFLVKLVNKK